MKGGRDPRLAINFAFVSGDQGIDLQDQNVFCVGP
jgi:hypothetical protein